MVSGYVQLDAAMDNTVASEGGVVRIKCEITGYPLPNYVWYKDGVAVDDAGDDTTRQTRINVKTTPWGSRSSTFICFTTIKVYIYIYIYETLFTP